MILCDNQYAQFVNFLCHLFLSGIGFQGHQEAFVCMNLELVFLI